MLKESNKSFGDPACLDSLVATSVLNNEPLFFFSLLIEQLSSKLRHKGCFLNFLWLPNYDFAACSLINFAACNPPQQDCHMIPDT